MGNCNLTDFIIVGKNSLIKPENICSTLLYADHSDECDVPGLA